eukprot:TRINITY_DN1280_c0_g1_i2.p1 TRINITY_DN1280_c0_g1~~TRINITY_DN1280_c0_g1_i2.p1  ORF type:complete len:445 (-),score=99.12 TRINITY_DN1280_c0_g1_i2:277-1515(-)
MIGRFWFVVVGLLASAPKCSSLHSPVEDAAAGGGVVGVPASASTSSLAAKGEGPLDKLRDDATSRASLEMRASSEAEKQLAKMAQDIAADASASRALVGQDGGKVDSRTSASSSQLNSGIDIGESLGEDHDDVEKNDFDDDDGDLDDDDGEVDIEDDDEDGGDEDDGDYDEEDEDQHDVALEELHEAQTAKEGNIADRGYIPAVSSSLYPSPQWDAPVRPAPLAWNPVSLFSNEEVEEAPFYGEEPFYDGDMYPAEFGNNDAFDPYAFGEEWGSDRDESNHRFSSDMPLTKGLLGRRALHRRMRQEGKPGMVVVTSSTCPVCDGLIKDMNSNRRTKAVMQNFVAISALDEEGTMWRTPDENQYWPRTYFVKDDGSFYYVRAPQEQKYPHYFWTADQVNDAMQTVLRERAAGH